jgi:protease I
MKALIITWENFQDQELIYPYYRLREEAQCEDDITVMSNVLGKFHGIMGSNMESHKLVSDLSRVDLAQKYLENYELLVIPGGVKALEKLRQERQVIEFIKRWNGAKKIIASTCHGAQLLISAKIVMGKKISGYYSIEDDITNAGATYVNSPVVMDENIVTSPHYKWMGEWMSSAIRLVKNGTK